MKEMCDAEREKTRERVRERERERKKKMVTSDIIFFIIKR